MFFSMLTPPLPLFLLPPPASLLPFGAGKQIQNNTKQASWFLLFQAGEVVVVVVVVAAAATVVVISLQFVLA